MKFLWKSNEIPLKFLQILWNSIEIHWNSAGELVGWPDQPAHENDFSGPKAVVSSVLQLFTKIIKNLPGQGLSAPGCICNSKFFGLEYFFARAKIFFVCLIVGAILRRSQSQTKRFGSFYKPIEICRNSIKFLETPMKFVEIPMKINEIL